MRKKLLILAVIAIVIAAIVIIFALPHEEEYGSFPMMKVEYKDADGNTGVYYGGHVGYRWPDLDNGEIEERQPDGGKKLIESQFDNLIPNSAAGSELKLIFEKAPDKIEIYTFGTDIPYDQCLSVSDATETKTIDESSKSYSIPKAAEETTYWVKAYFGDMYIFYYIAISDVELS